MVKRATYLHLGQWKEAYQRWHDNHLVRFPESWLDGDTPIRLTQSRIIVSELEDYWKKPYYSSASRCKHYLLHPSLHKMPVMVDVLSASSDWIGWKSRSPQLRGLARTQTERDVETRSEKARISFILIAVLPFACVLWQERKPRLLYCRSMTRRIEVGLSRVPHFTSPSLGHPVRFWWAIHSQSYLRQRINC